MVFHTHLFDGVSGRLSISSPHDAASNCVKRSPTRHQHDFDLLRPNPVSFDFSTGDPLSFEVTIPAGSAWEHEGTFHLDPAQCIAIDTLRGWTWVTFNSLEGRSGSTRTDPGYHYSQTPHSFLQWGNHDQETAQAVRVTGDVQLYRTLCSVTQDAELYYRLCTTPLWIRLLFATLGHTPFYGKAAQERLIHLALYIQLRVIFYKNDCWPDHGTVRIDWYWWTAPDWVRKFQAWTTVLISQTILCLLYWLGRIALGLRESYYEYNVPIDTYKVVESKKCQI
jgi:hypothetical protein